MLRVAELMVVGGDRKKSAWALGIWIGRCFGNNLENIWVDLRKMYQMRI